VIWLAEPKRNVRRVFYYGYHNDDPKQRFQSSLSIGRVLEDPPGMEPVILCYKLNGQWLTSKRGRPKRWPMPYAIAHWAVLIKTMRRVNMTFAAGLLTPMVSPSRCRGLLPRRGGTILRRCTLLLSEYAAVPAAAKRRRHSESHIPW